MFRVQGPTDETCPFLVLHRLPPVPCGCGPTQLAGRKAKRQRALEAEQAREARAAAAESGQAPSADEQRAALAAQLEQEREAELQAMRDKFEREKAAVLAEEDPLLQLVARKRWVGRVGRLAAVLAEEDPLLQLVAQKR